MRTMFSAKIQKPGPSRIGNERIRCHASVVANPGRTAKAGMQSRKIKFARIRSQIRLQGVEKNQAALFSESRTYVPIPSVIEFRGCRQY
ncbi:MAG: hypothetical protein RMM53_00615 [Bacteroidia bacterium]|nr:hypothetical protein [Bacteroidia bacterium]MDW8332697.1 hypothetical protein [Bacteroidia bacterium]